MTKLFRIISSFHISKCLYLLIGSALIGSGIGYGKLYLYHIILAFVILIFGIYSIENKFFLKIENINLLIKKNKIFLFWFIWTVLSFSWTINYNETLKYLVYQMFGIICILSVKYYVTNEKRLKSFTHLIKCIFLFNLFISLFESFGLFRWPLSPYSDYSNFFGREFQELNNNGQLFLSGIFPPTGLFGNPNNLSLFCVVISPFIFLHAKGLNIIVCFMSIIWILLTSGSRAAMLGLLIGFLFYFFMFKKKMTEIGFLIAFSSLSIIGVFFLILLKPNSFSTLVENVNIFNILIIDNKSSLNSTAIRLNLIYDSWEAFQKTLGIGLGGGGTYSHQLSMGGYGQGVARLHNFWLEILFESGVLVFFGLMLWFISKLKNLIFIAKTSKRKWISDISKAFCISIIIFIVGTLSISTAIYFLPMWILFGAIISFIDFAEKNN